MALSAKLKKSINIGLRIFIAILALWFIYRQIVKGGNFQSLIDHVRNNSHNPSFVVPALLAFCMMPLNWGIEAYKWRKLILFAEPITYYQAFKSVLTGISVSLFTPNRVGEFFGRLMTLKKAPAIKGAFLTITGSISQLMTTLLFGMFALCIFIPEYYSLNDSGYYFVWLLVCFSCLVSGVAMILLYFKVPVIYKIAGNLIKPGWDKMRNYLRIMRRLERKLLLTVLLLSMLRYMVFSSQFYLLLLAFGLHIDWFNAFILISMTYFAMTAIPTIALVDLGIRGSVSIYFLGLYFSDTQDAGLLILAATTAVWIINLAIPSLIGLLFINRLKLIRKPT